MTTLYRIGPVIPAGGGGGGAGVPTTVLATAEGAIPDGAPVYAKDSTVPGTAVVALANADTEAKSRVVGLAANAIGDGAAGYIAVSGVTNVPDAIWAAVPATTDVGKYAYLHTTNGMLSMTAPSVATQWVIKVGIITQGGAGAVFVDVQIGDGILLT